MAAVEAATKSAELAECPELNERQTKITGVRFEFSSGDLSVFVSFVIFRYCENLFGRAHSTRLIWSSFF
jgi:uncharacterized PurR-regulated membrane protein YhhQ (DUF165 family)